MTNIGTKLGFISIFLGGVALISALVHFYAGPFAPQDPIEVTIADKAVAIRDATVAALKGEEIEKEAPTYEADIDQIVRLATMVLGGVALMLGVTGLALGGKKRATISGAVLGGFAIVFQFVTVALGAILFVVLVVAVLGALGIGVG